jgi:hypothetical protein
MPRVSMLRLEEDGLLAAAEVFTDDGDDADIW